MVRLLPLITQRSFYASASSLNLLLGYIDNLTAFKLDLKTLTKLTKKPQEGFLIFIIYLLQWPQISCLKLLKFYKNSRIL